MTPITAATLLMRIRLELARDHDYPQGSRDHGYDFIAPINAAGHIDAEAWKLVRERCRVKRFWGHDAAEVGHVIRRPGGSWAFHYDIHGDADNDETGYRFDSHLLRPGEYLSIKEHDGTLRTFFVKSVVDLD